MWSFLFALTSASAATTCLTVDEFNAWMVDHPAATDVTLRFDLTGVDPAAFAGSKGALADLTDLGCAAGGSLALKVYGPDDPPNEAHPAGTLKHEYGYNCGPLPYTETWADPNASAVIFADGTERCDATIWIDPLTFGYRLDCDHGTFEAVGDNTPAMPVSWITLFGLTNPDTWRIDGAVSTWNEVCFETDEAPPEGTVPLGDPRTDTFLAVEDVTAAVDHPDTVFPDLSDLCVEAGYCETYLKFDLSSLQGTIVSASLELNARDDGSANGSGAELFAVPGTTWTADTLTWSTRPLTGGGSLGRIGPIAAGLPYGFDVTDLVDGPRVVAFALLPGAEDTDGAHFVSTEDSNTLAPRLVVTWVPDEADPTGDDPNPSPIDPPSLDPTVPVGREMGCGCDSSSAPWAWVTVVAALIATGSRRRRPR